MEAILTASVDSSSSSFCALTRSYSSKEGKLISGGLRYLTERKLEVVGVEQVLEQDESMDAT